MLSLKALMK